MNSDTHTQLILKWLPPYFIMTKTEMIFNTGISLQTNEDRIMRSSPWGSSTALVFWHQQWLGATSPSPKICGKIDPLEKRRLRPISAYNVSTVRASEKSSIVANRKSIMRFPTSYRWSTYVTPTPPKGGSTKSEFVVFVNKNQFKSNKLCYKVSKCENVERQCCTRTIPYITVYRCWR